MHIMRLCSSVDLLLEKVEERERKKKRMRRAVDTRKVGNHRIDEKAPPIIIAVAATTKRDSSRQKLDTIYEEYKDPHGCSTNPMSGVSCPNCEG